MSSMESLDFDSPAPKDVPFRYRNKSYSLREASHDKAREYRSALLASYRPGAGGLLPGENLPRTELVLLAGCVYDQDDKPVPVEEMKTWPNRVIRPLFERVREMSYLTDLDTSSVDALDKEISRLQKLRDQLSKEPEDGQGGAAGNSPGGGTVNSA